MSDTKATAATAARDAAPLEATAREVLRIEGAALLQMADELPEGFAAAVRRILSARGRVVTSGMGKSGHVAHKIAATLSSTGTPALFVHPAEASHGDLGMITRDDVCLFISNSGETREMHDLVAYCRRFAIPIISVTKAPDSTLARESHIALVLPDAPEACGIGMAPTTSTTCSMALGDALAITLMRLRGFDGAAFHVFHPGGKLGAQFLRVGDMMHTGERLPLVTPEMAMGEVLVTMTAKGFGVALVMEGARLAGVITDGDLRRHLDGLMDKQARDVATPTPRTIRPDGLASEALGIMNANAIGALPVTDARGDLEGLLHIHDCLRAGVA